MVACLADVKPTIAGFKIKFEEIVRATVMGSGFAAECTGSNDDHASVRAVLEMLV